MVHGSTGETVVDGFGVGKNFGPGGGHGEHGREDGQEV